MNTRKTKRQLETSISIYQKCKTGAEAVNKITRYLMDTYGEQEPSAQAKAIKIVKDIKGVIDGK